MWRNCPSLVLSGELEVPGPRVVLVMGRRAAPQVQELLQATVTDQRPGFERMRGTLDGRDLEMLACNHPNFHRWQTSYDCLVEWLVESPLG